MTRQISDTGLTLIKRFEGLKLTPYRDSAGLWTVGYGHLVKKGEPVAAVTLEQAEDLLRKDLTFAQVSVESAVHVPLNENEYASCVSLAYNIGGDAFAHSTLCKLLNKGDRQGAADAFLSWNKATVKGKKVVIEGLARRRRAERELFLKSSVDPRKGEK